MPKVLGVITARGGSKGIPGKNIKSLLGKPLIAYTIEAAQKSGALDRLIVSTDDPQIAEVARQNGCEVPFIRPKELAEDHVLHLEVMQHAVTVLKEKEGYAPDYAMILQPTSPLRQPFHIKEAADLIIKSKADSVVSVSEIPENYSPHKAMVLERNGILRLFNGNPVYMRMSQRQELPKTYWSIGMMYLFKPSLLFDSEHPNFYGEKVMPYIIEKKYVVDINIPEDWKAAERALKKLLHG
ncbi:MAG: N-acylneuraminate cytidylyltransferase [Parcubacteria group bacterium Gr01-1014_33]|nr:MAG: N-acylneuraminate cytidylyltransferase [Parcubacteria group bacterium Gr01-1014_33]